MYNAKLYADTNQLPRFENTKLLNEYASTIKWKKHGDRTIDIGCGDGGVTCEILRRYLPENYERLVGCDISREMVEHASRHYSDHRTEFMQLDIACDDMPNHLLGSFDHAFSFFVFHWTKSYKKAFENTYKLLDGGGDCLISIMGYTPNFEAYKTMAKNKKWADVMGDIDPWISPFCDLIEPEKEVAKVMSNIGFKNIKVRQSKNTFVYEDMQIFKEAAVSVCPFTRIIPEDMVEEFIEEYLYLIHTVRLTDEHKEKYPYPYPVIRDYVLISAYGVK